MDSSMNHLTASQRDSSPGIPNMQISSHLLEPAAIMSRKMETKTVDYTVHTHTHTRLQGIPPDTRKKSAYGKEVRYSSQEHLPC